MRGKVTMTVTTTLEPSRTPRKSLKRYVPVLDFCYYPDLFSEFYPDSGGYLQIFSSYPDYDIYYRSQWV